LGFGTGVLIMQRYVVVDADGYAVNVVLWDGETPFGADGELVLESECKAIPREQEQPE
jgi:hypothetical protein